MKTLDLRAEAVSWGSSCAIDRRARRVELAELSRLAGSIETDGIRRE